MADSTYSYTADGGRFKITRNGATLKSPSGKPLSTSKEVVAKQIVADIVELGEDPSSPKSAATYQYARLDMNNEANKEMFTEFFKSRLNEHEDWAYRCPSANPHFFMRWHGLFGEPYNNLDKIHGWIDGMTMNQLVAVLVWTAHCNSIVIPYMVGSVIFEEDRELYASELAETGGYGDTEENEIEIDRFLMFYRYDDLK